MVVFALAFGLGLALAAPAAGAEPAFTVALDAGHGGTNLGAPALKPGLYEKDITLEIARRIGRRLEREGRVKVVQCRKRDELLTVRARVRCANQAGARLFLSLHANASPEVKRGSQRGFELYVRAVAEVEGDAALAAVAAPTAADGAWTARRVRVAAAESLAAARRLRWQLGDTLGTAHDRGIKQGGATLDVLQELTMPAVLVEVGFLDHPEEGALLASEAGWDKVAGALATAISDLRAREMRGRSDPSITARKAGARPAPGPGR